MFGADNFATNFEKQLSDFKAGLVTLYRQKTSISAERESYRFQYLSGIKAKLQTLFGAMASKIFTDQNPLGETLILPIIASIQANIPMVTLNGEKINGWGDNVQDLGGRYNLGFLSPLDQFIEKPFAEIDDPDRRPAYKIYDETYFLAQTSENLTEYSFLGNLIVSNDGQNIGFEFPPTKEWVKGFASGRVIDVEGVLSEYPYVLAILTGTYSGLKLSDVLVQAKSLLRKVIDKTKDVLRVQEAIDQAEIALAQFVDQYKQFLGGRTFDSLLTDIKNEAASTPVADVSQPVKSNPFFLIAAAVGIYLVTKDK